MPLLVRFKSVENDWLANAHLNTTEDEVRKCRDAIRLAWLALTPAQQWNVKSRREFARRIAVKTKFSLRESFDGEATLFALYEPIQVWREATGSAFRIDQPMTKAGWVELPGVFDERKDEDEQPRRGVRKADQRRHKSAAHRRRRSRRSRGRRA